MIPLIGDLHPVRILLDGSAGLVVLALHGLFLALAAKALGDPGPTFDGRLTGDPTEHVDLYALIGMVLTQFAWLKPMDIRASDIRGGWAGILVACLTALVATWVLGRIVMAGRGLVIAIAPPDLLQIAEAWLFTFVRFSDRIALFNLLPVFSLTAAHAVRGFLPAPLRATGPLVSALTLALAIVVKLWIWR